MESGQRVAFISGANRGIGFGLTLEMVQHGCKVAAGYRDEGRSEKLLAEAEKQRNILPVKVDVTIEDDLKHLYRFIENHCGHLNILVNSAGVSINESAEVNELNWEDLARNLEVNVGGPLMISRTLYPLLQRGKEKKIINISSQMGSIQLTDGGATPFRVSKAALNMLSRNQAIEYKEAGIAVVIVHPGWVKTDMGGPAAPMTVAESTRKIFQIIEMISLSNTGEFISVTGDRIPY
ncbi:MAG: SDR family oxidoreductase [Deltaproteobacteria bacterium]|jgi:NAD(P)-dependent dehydrogenase (short-subunit alcohol dehydrogenase family)